MSTFKEHTDTGALELARRVAALPEARMRLATLAAQLAAAPADEAAALLDGLIRGALRRDPSCVGAYAALVDPDPVMATAPKAVWEAMLAAASAAGHVAAMHWLGAPLHPEEPRREIDADRLVAFGLREMTLGDRRALARRARGDTLLQLASDPDPGVIHNLLNNPKTTEAIVLTLVSRRPTVAPPLCAVLQSRRWLQRYRVKLGLVRNPYLPLRYGLNLLVYLNRVDLEDVGRDESLAGTLRLGCQRLRQLLDAAAALPVDRGP